MKTGARCRHCYASLWKGLQTNTERPWLRWLVAAACFPSLSPLCPVTRTVSGKVLVCCATTLLLRATSSQGANSVKYVERHQDDRLAAGFGWCAATFTLLFWRAWLCPHGNFSGKENVMDRDVKEDNNGLLWSSVSWTYHGGISHRAMIQSGPPQTDTHTDDWRARAEQHLVGEAQRSSGGM